MGFNNPRWEHAVIDAYKPLESVKGWKKCIACKEFPRVWIFDNGRYAKCCCGDKYSQDGAQAESIMSVYKRTGKTAEYDPDELRVAWNLYVTTGHPVKLKDERW